MHSVIGTVRKVRGVQGGSERRVRMRRVVALVILASLVAASAAVAASTAVAASAAVARAPRKTAASFAPSLYMGPGPRPGPAILYKPVATAPQLTNAGPWHAAPILVSGAMAYRDGEFLWQDWLYSDDGAHETPDPSDPRTSGNLFSKPNGTYTYPTGPGYDDDAADLVEFRVKPTRTATLFRITLNTLQNPRLIAFSIALGGRRGVLHSFPDGANVSAPAKLFLTVHPATGRKLVANLVHASNDTRVKGRAPRVKVDMYRKQITVSVPHTNWNPRRTTVRMAMGIGLWDAAHHDYLLPQATATATEPGGAGTDQHPAAFFNVAFRTNAEEPYPSVTASTGVLTDPRWWRDEAQGKALAAGNISEFHANVSFRKLWKKVTDNSQVPKTGPIDRILPSHFQTGPGAQFSKQCGLQGSSDPKSCVPEYEGRLQPYEIYVPPGGQPKGGYGLTLMLHSLSANYNQYMNTRNQREFADRPVHSITITPEARGPDQFYEGLGEADVFEVWAAVAHLYHLNPAYTDITGYSMGGFGTFDIGAQFPDLFGRAQPTVGEETDNDVLPSFRNLPVLMWNNTADELVPATDYGPTADKLASLGYRYQLDAFQPCDNPHCSPVFPDHLELAINDQFAPAAAFLGTAKVDRNPAHVTYVVDPARDASEYGVVANHAYWVSGLSVRTAGSIGEIDAISEGFGVGDPAASGSHAGTGELVGGNFGTLVYASSTQTWGRTPKSAVRNVIKLTATNIAKASIDVKRARVNCHATVDVTSDGPIAVTLAGCHRVVHGS